jgi:hypothetical protein
MQKLPPRVVCAVFIASMLGIPLASAAPEFPAGKYQAGEVSMQFDGRGHFKVSKGGQAVVDGEYTARADQIKLTDKSGAWACSSKGEETGSYLWKYEGDTLTFSKVEDRCEGRAGDLPQHGWKRQE